MTERPSDNGLDQTKIVSIYRHQGPKRRHYTRRWKSLCREILCEFQVHLSAMTGGAIKWDRIRKLIMRPYDKYDQDVLVEEDTRLRRQDLEYWVKHDSDMDDAKFAFIDLFIRKELISNKHGLETVIDKIVAHRDQENMQALAAVFQGLFYKDSAAAMVLLWPRVLRRLFRLDGQADDSHTYLYFCTTADGGETVARAILFISATPYASAQSLIARSKKYFGYVVPISFSNETRGQEPLAKLLLFDRSSVDGLRVNTFSDSFLSERRDVLNCIAAIPADQLAKNIATDIRYERDRQRADAIRSGDKEKFQESMRRDQERPGFTEIEIDDQEAEQLERLKDEYLVW